MDRSDVVDLVVLMPMRIKLQKENDEWVALMPGWQLPARGLLVTGENTTDAINKLDDAMRRYWGD